ncbi:MAG: hypothetical protein ABSF09_05035, partial [Candidatus Bathyarchaeia archaeon]|jgi:hypothetical protein
MADDAWLVSKQAQYLKDVIAAREVSIELLECLRHFTKEVLDETIKTELANRPNTAYLITKAQELLVESDRITGILLQPSPNEMLQQELTGLPNVDVTLPLVTKFISDCY